MKEFLIKDHVPSLLPEGKQWKLAWSDEFDGDTLDMTKWSYRRNFWGKPFQTYTDEGVTLDGKGNVHISLIERDGQFYSAQLQTGANSFDNPQVTQKNPWGQDPIWTMGEIDKPKFMHRFGYYECRCKLQEQPGWWSAFWLQSPSIGTAYEPKYCGIEVDIMESFDRDNSVTSGCFYGGYGAQHQSFGRVNYKCEDTPDGYHRFGLDWSEEGYVFYCDGRETCRTDSTLVSYVDQFILLTTECMGYRSGNRDKPDDRIKKAVLPDAFVADYVRVFDEVK